MAQVNVRATSNIYTWFQGTQRRSFTCQVVRSWWPRGETTTMTWATGAATITGQMVEQIRGYTYALIEFDEIVKTLEDLELMHARLLSDLELACLRIEARVEEERRGALPTLVLEPGAGTLRPLRARGPPGTLNTPKPAPHHRHEPVRSHTRAGSCR